jgi:two-component system, OmpR family, phosphate regulon sensor histidine kinase PhoR
VKRRLFIRILVSYVVVILLVVAIVAVLFSRQIRLNETKKIEESLLRSARMVTLLPLADMKSAVYHLAETAEARVTVIDGRGGVLADSRGDASRMERHLNRPEVEEARLRGFGKSVRRSSTLQDDEIYVAVAIRDGETIRGYVRMGRSLREVEDAVHRMYGFLYRAIGFALLPALLLAILYTWKISRPLREIRDYTHAIRQGELPGTLFVKASGELGQVAEDINYLVTEYREKIRLAHEEKGKLESALSSMVEGIVILDSQGRIESCNRGIEAILDRPESEIRRRTLLEAFMSADLQKALESFRRERKPVLQEISLGGKQPMIVDVSISAIQDLPEGEEKTLLVFHDVTRLKKLEQMRTDFVANVTHEIRTPLTAIIGFLQTLLAGALDDLETARKFLQTIANNAERLSRLVDDLLTLSSIELNETTLNLEPLSLDALIRTVLPMVEAAADEKKIALDVQIPERVPKILADRDRAAQVLMNVLHNAVKFTPHEGRVTISGHEVETTENVVLKVEDTGIGIPSREIPRLGERFYRVDKARSRELGGTGLGLSIVKHLMAAHGGKMEIASTLGKGTTVSLFFQKVA